MGPVISMIALMDIRLAVNLDANARELKVMVGIRAPGFYCTNTNLIPLTSIPFLTEEF